MNKKELLSELIEVERGKLNRLIEEELLPHKSFACEGTGGGESHSRVCFAGRSEETSFCKSDAVYYQSRYLDRLIELYMECA